MTFANKFAKAVQRKECNPNDVFNDWQMVNEFGVWTAFFDAASGLGTTFLTADLPWFVLRAGTTAAHEVKVNRPINVPHIAKFVN